MSTLPEVSWRRCPSCEWVYEGTPGKCPRCSNGFTQRLSDTRIATMVKSGELQWCDACDTYHIGSIKLARYVQ